VLKNIKLIFSYLLLPAESLELEGAVEGEVPVVAEVPFGIVVEELSLIDVPSVVLEVSAPSEEELSSFIVVPLSF